MANKAHLKVLKQGVKAWNRWRVNHPRVKPDLSGADLECRHLDGANFALANLNGANLGNADLDAANLFGAKMRRAYLSTAILSQADLTAADLANADLSSSTLYQAKLDDANLREANLDNIQMESTQLGANDLRTVKGLETVAHTGPSLIGIDTIYLSKGDIPEVFLRGAGVPESFIANMKALVAAMEPIQFYSCFISYSSKDDDFAKRLYFDLQREGVRCWFAPEDLKIGAETRTGIV